MATRNHHAAAAQQPANRGAAVQAGKQKIAAAGRRRALGDIGNVVTDVLDGKIQLPEGINRPITRSFGAQLLKNAALANKVLALYLILQILASEAFDLIQVSGFAECHASGQACSGPCGPEAGQEGSCKARPAP
jgi:hypothetical protein